ncbi:MAG TPA: hypothetical protein VED17_11540 [Nitrososphaerales archaeon]|nr:hypothetical protein [Nitrososphaerales archaeon]
MAYFTEPMGDEFKKAIEEALKEMESEESGHKENGKGKKIRPVRKKKDPARRLSRTSKKSLK